MPTCWRSTDISKSPTKFMNVAWTYSHTLSHSNSGTCTSPKLSSARFQSNGSETCSNRLLRTVRLSLRKRSTSCTAISKKSEDLHDLQCGSMRERQEQSQMKIE